MKKIIFALVLFVLQKPIYAQGILSGKLLDYQAQNPIFNAVITVENTNLTVFSNQEGLFEIKNIPVGKQILAIKSKGYEDKFFEVFIENQQTFL
jgi:CarboxypepD_reg-like domain